MFTNVSLNFQLFCNWKFSLAYTIYIGYLYNVVLVLYTFVGLELSLIWLLVGISVE